MGICTSHVFSAEATGSGLGTSLPQLILDCRPIAPPSGAKEHSRFGLKLDSRMLLVSLLTQVSFQGNMYSIGNYRTV